MSYRDDDIFFDDVEEALKNKYGDHGDEDLPKVDMGLSGIRTAPPPGRRRPAGTYGTRPRPASRYENTRRRPVRHNYEDELPNEEEDTEEYAPHGGGPVRPSGKKPKGKKGKMTEEQEKRLAYHKFEARSGRKPSRKEKKLIDKKIHSRRRKEKLGKVFKGFLAVIALLVLFVVFLFYTKPGKRVLLRFASVYVKKATKGVDKEEIEGIPFKSPENIPDDWAYNENVINILLIGADASGGERTNTDSMIIFSENTITGQVTLVSLLRDTYVDIYGQNVKRKLNYAYRADGIGCLMGTIESTYKIYLDSYAIVDFQAFRDVVDKLGGVDLYISSEEASYLNSETLIKNGDNRNLKEGINHLNGDQANGYCRVRAIGTRDDNGNLIIDDHGRTLRQRKVLRAIYDNYKNEDILTVYSATNSVLGNITTPISSGNIYTMLEGIYFNDSKEMKQMQIPDASKYSYQSISGVGSVVSIDGYLEDNINILREALYGDLTY